MVSCLRLFSLTEAISSHVLLSSFSIVLVKHTIFLNYILGNFLTYQRPPRSVESMSSVTHSLVQYRDGWLFFRLHFFVSSNDATKLTSFLGFLFHNSHARTEPHRHAFDVRNASKRDITHVPIEPLEQSKGRSTLAFVASVEFQRSSSSMTTFLEILLKFFDLGIVPSELNEVHVHLVLHRQLLFLFVVQLHWEGLS